MASGSGLTLLSVSEKKERCSSSPAEEKSDDAAASHQKKKRKRKKKRAAVGENSAEKTTEEEPSRGLGGENAAELQDRTNVSAEKKAEDVELSGANAPGKKRKRREKRRRAAAPGQEDTAGTHATTPTKKTTLRGRCSDVIEERRKRVSSKGYARVERCCLHVSLQTVMASVLEPAVQFAQRLASNEKPVRTKAMKKLRKYISVRSQKAAGKLAATAS